jgi:dipeptidyl aminopeptidase/acylaminoacyl peptidase
MKKLALFLVLTIAAAVANGQPYTIQQYLNIKSAISPEFAPDGGQIAYLTNVSGTWQVWAITLPAGKPRQLTNYDDNVGFVRWAGDELIFGKAKGGDENTQFYWMKADGSGVKALTNDPTVRYNFGDVSWDGKTIYYASNKRDRTFFDVYSMDLASGKETLLYQQDGNNDFVAANDSGTKIIISRDGTEFSLDNNLYLIDTATHAETLLTPHKGASQYYGAQFVADGIVLAHNDGREFASLAEIRRKNAAIDDWSAKNRVTDIIDNTSWDVGDIEMHTYGSTIAYTLDRDGFSELYLRKYETDGKPLITVIDKTSEQVKLPGQGIVGGMSFNKDQTKLAFAYQSASRNSDLWVYDLATKELKEVTWSDRADIAPESFIEPHLVHYKTYDGRDISAWFYEPTRPRSFTLNMNAPSDKALKMTKPAVPIIVSVHGGPEGQERPGFNPLYQYFLSRGYAILAPNVRGSTGYGKMFTHLDDVKKREDSVKDLAYAVEWLKASGNADPKRIAVMGGSYGGYMTLAAITLYPDLWAAAVDTVGIANWETFVKNTSGYRRRQREVEYGRLDRDIDFLRSASPIYKVDRIKAPLFVIAGKNDPRVPWTEGEQIVNALKKLGRPVQWKLYEDEGYGVSKLKNRLELYPLVADFLDKYMK